jgi:hypothetical protein
MRPRPADDGTSIHPTKWPIGVAGCHRNRKVRESRAELAKYNSAETPFSTAQHIGSEFPQCGAEHKVAFKAEGIVYGGTAEEATCEFSRFEPL